jgi:hypothetical protein
VFPQKRDERVLVVWSDNLDGIIPLCRDFDDSLIKLVWSRRHSLTSLIPGPSLAPTPGATSVTNSASDVDIDEKRQEIEVTTSEPEPNAKPISGGSLWGWRIGSKAKRAPARRDLERGGRSARPTRYFAPVYGGLGLALSTCKLFKIFVVHSFVLTGILPSDFIGSGVSILLQEWRLTEDYTRFALLVTAPLLFCVSLVSPRFLCVSVHDLSARRQFFSMQVITNISYVYVRQLLDIRQIAHDP